MPSLVGNPHVRFTDTLLALPVVAQLKGTPLYQLLEIFATKDFKAFADFAAHHTELFATLGTPSSPPFLFLCSLPLCIYYLVPFYSEGS